MATATGSAPSNGDNSVPDAAMAKADGAQELHHIAPPVVAAHAGNHGPLRALLVMLKRNWILYVKRYWRSTLAQVLLAPLFFLLLLWGLQQADYRQQQRSNRHPQAYDLPGLIGCQGPEAADPCVNLLFTPNTDQIRGILGTFAGLNAKATGQAAWQFESAMNVSEKPKRVMGGCWNCRSRRGVS